MSIFSKFTNWFKQDIEPISGKPRSPKWDSVRKNHLKKNAVCEICGGSLNLNVHHILPFHIRPELELEESNLITLCEKSHIAGMNCHFIFGHFGRWTDYNPKVREISKLYNSTYEGQR